MATIITKPGNTKKPYTVRYWADGKQRERSFRLKRDATDFMTKTEHEIREQVYADPKLGSVKFCDYASEWISSRRAASTKRIYEQTLRLYIQPWYETKTLKAVAADRESAQRLLNGLTPSRQVSVNTVLTGTLNAAVKAGRIPSHRLQGLSVAHVSARAHIIHATKEQLDQISQLLPDGYGLVVWFARGCGLRLGEALAVTPDCIRDNGTTLRIHEQILTSGQYSPLKHRKPGDYRDIPLPAYVAGKMRDWNGFQPITRSMFNRAWRNACRQAGLPDTFIPHTLRHTYAAVALHQGIPISEVSRFMGHQSIEITHQVYGYLVPNAVGRTAAVIDSEYSAWSDQ
jgi:integrase